MRLTVALCSSPRICSLKTIGHERKPGGCAQNLIQAVAPAAVLLNFTRMCANQMAWSQEQNMQHARLPQQAAWQI